MTQYPLVKTVDNGIKGVFLKLLEYPTEGYLMAEFYHQIPYDVPYLVRRELIAAHCKLDNRPLRQIPEFKINQLSTLLTYS